MNKLSPLDGPRYDVGVGVGVIHALKIAKIRSRIWRMTFYLPAPVNCWLWQEEDGLSLIDAAQPWNAQSIARVVKQIGEPLKRIIITHAHPDHAGSAAELAQLTGAGVYAHHSDASFLEGTTCMANEPGYVMCRLLLNSAHRLSLLTPPKVSDVSRLAHDTTIGSLRVLHTPGHTPGSISLWSEQEGALFCGDNISNSWNLLRLNFTWFTLDSDLLRRSVSIYKKLPVQLILPGHGPPCNKTDAIERVLSDGR